MDLLQTIIFSPATRVLSCLFVMHNFLLDNSKNDDLYTRNLYSETTYCDI